MSFRTAILLAVRDWWTRAPGPQLACSKNGDIPSTVCFAKCGWWAPCDTLLPTTSGMFQRLR
jgi:hypothetical protein